jgi:ABC-type branched-subunit amino acid transport system substrate-binding protein
MEQGRRTIQRRTFTAITTIIAAAVTATATVAACGSPQRHASQNSDRSCTAAPGVTANSIKIGLLYPNSGPVSGAFTAYRAGVDARLGVANAAGGVNGRQLSYTWRDDESSPSANLAGARGLVDQDEAFGIIETTTVATGSAAFLHDHGVPVTGVALEPVWNVNDNMFAFVNFVGSGSVSTWGDYVTAQGGRNALILRLAFSDAMRIQVEKMSASLQATGVNIAGVVDLIPGTVDPNRLGARIKASHADTVIGLLPPEVLDEAVISARAAGVTLNAAISYAPGYDQSLLQKYGQRIAGASYYLYYSPFELATLGHRKFLTAMAEYAPQVQPAAQGGAVSGWIAADMMIRGLQEAGDCLTRTHFIAGLRAVDNYNADGLLPAALDVGKSLGQMTRCLTFVRVSTDGTHFDVIQPIRWCGRSISSDRP